MKATKFDRKFDAGEDVTTDLDLPAARRPLQDAGRHREGKGPGRSSDVRTLSERHHLSTMEQSDLEPKEYVERRYPSKPASLCKVEDA